jgi:hypothetical protein
VKILPRWGSGAIPRAPSGGGALEPSGRAAWPRAGSAISLKFVILSNIEVMKIKMMSFHPVSREITGRFVTNVKNRANTA